MSTVRSLLTFRGGTATYAVDVGDVRRVVSAVELRPLPATPRFVAGVYSRGSDEVLILDLARLLTGAEFSELTAPAAPSAD